MSSFKVVVSCSRDVLTEPLTSLVKKHLDMKTVAEVMLGSQLELHRQRLPVRGAFFRENSVFTKENPKFSKDFPPLPNPLKPFFQGKHPNNQGNSLLKIYQGNPNNQGKEGQGPPLP